MAQSLRRSEVGASPFVGQSVASQFSQAGANILASWAPTSSPSRSLVHHRYALPSFHVTNEHSSSCTYGACSYSHSSPPRARWASCIHVTVSVARFLYFILSSRTKNIFGSRSSSDPFIIRKPKSMCTQLKYTGYSQ